MFLIRLIASVLCALSMSHASAAGSVECARADVACKMACPMDTRRAGCYQACHTQDMACRVTPTTNAAMPPPRYAVPQAALPQAVPGANPVIRQQELIDSGACRASATSCQGSCAGASANPGSAAGFQHMECVRQCKVTQSLCGLRAAEVERGARLPNGSCAPRYRELGEPGKGSCAGPYN